MKAEYKRDLQNNYLVFEIPDYGEEDGYSIHMVEQNKIQGLLTMHSSRKNGVLRLNYEITSKQALENIFEKKTMSFQDIVFVLGGIRDTLEELQKYLLNPSQIVFHPQYIFVEPGRKKIDLCYIPGMENEMPISLLAEFILKRLDHEERQAIEIGYGFFQKVQEENFSLQKTLKELLTEVKSETDSVASENYISNETKETRKEKAKGSFPEGQKQVLSDQERYDFRENLPSDYPRDFLDEGTGIPQRTSPRERGKKGYTKRGEGREKEREKDKEKDREKGGEKDKEKDREKEREYEYEVIHKKRKKNMPKWIETLFQFIHPGVLLSCLFLLAVLEIAYYFGFLNLTEAGGIFFLLISGETLINKFWKSRQEKQKAKENKWADEEESEWYKILQEEMYEMQERREPVIEETKCLVQNSRNKTAYLTYLHGGIPAVDYPDIFIGQNDISIGKIKGESDIILDSPTVSRIHARLMNRGGQYFIKDLNSRNGTFCNGDRLHPQEERQITSGDIISFAEIEYRVTER